MRKKHGGGYKYTNYEVRLKKVIVASIFPTVLKTAKVVPLYKNKNSWPISILSIFSKNILNDQTKLYFEPNDLFY